MKLNRRRGATLGLVAVAVLVIIVLGVGFFILSQILGGGREVANATDAGVLNVARRALSPTLIQVQLPADSDSNPTKDFLGAAINAQGIANTSTGGTDPTHNRISMLAVNRLIAQSIIVALNAQEIGTNTASTHAHAVADAAKQVSTTLKNLVEGSTLDNEFSVVARSNNTKMFQGNKVELTGLQSSFLRRGLSTNVYIHPDLETSVVAGLPSNLKNSNAQALCHDGLAQREKYMAGYTDFTVNAGPSGPITIAGVPIFPKQKPHLVDTNEYNAGASNPPASAAYLPPNAFRANSRTPDNNSGGFGGAVACALVGALDQDFAASIPRGYVRIRNGINAASDPANGPITSSPVVDAGSDVFNNELWGPNGGVDVTNNGVYALRSDSDYSAANAYNSSWQAYNNAPDPKPPKPTFPPPANVWDSIYKVDNSPAGFKTNLPEYEFEAMTAEDNCETVGMYTKAFCLSSGLGDFDIPGPGTLVYSIIGATGGLPGNGAPPNSTGYTAVEVQKHDLLSRRFGSGRCARVQPVVGGTTTGTPNSVGNFVQTGKPYGMKQFVTTQCYATPSVQVNFGAPGSPLALIEQIGSSSATAATRACTTEVIGKILKRMRQADPTITEQKVRDALASQPLELGEQLYLYSPGPGVVALINGTAGDYFKDSDNLATDGTSSPAIQNCENQYNLAQTIVNSRKSGNGCPGHGDAGFHEVPYQEGPSNLPGIDRAVWTPASGWRNLLGEIHFQNEATGAGQFCKPN
jgi:hypothetical protein